MYPWHAPALTRPLHSRRSRASRSVVLSALPLSKLTLFTPLDALEEAFFFFLAFVGALGATAVKTEEEESDAASLERV